ncbi:glycine-rich cell wall structural protein [Folsomia candida]|uniref:glycine-rich cell wall structural protein n=1 Tax=Folsomia candida TaxID=158441 RepID=UPI000B8F893E|nr:glycine-rich cell wall structural protein [Folsomia candida]
MKIFIAITLLACVTFCQAGYGGHHVVTPDIIHHVSKVLSHGYGSKVILGYPQKAHLVDVGHSVDHYGGYGHGHGHYGGGYHGGYGGGHYGGGYGHGGHHYASPVAVYYSGHGHGHHGGYGHGGYGHY